MNLALPSLNFKMYNPSGKDNTSIRTLYSSSQVTDKFAYDLPVALYTKTGPCSTPSAITHVVAGLVTGFEAVALVRAGFNAGVCAHSPITDKEKIFSNNFLITFVIFVFLIEMMQK